MGGGDRDPAAVRAAAHAILSQPQFRQAPESVVDHLRTWVGEALRRALDAVLGGHLTLLGGAVLAVVLVLVAWLAVRAGRGVTDPGVRLPAEGRAARTAEDWRAEAAGHEQRGDWRAALRCHYRALIAELSRRGMVEEIPGRTTGEYRREVRRAGPGVAQEFDGATELFEVVVYGDQPAGADEVGAMRRHGERVLAAAR
jgi:hypothetical protein